MAKILGVRVDDVSVSKALELVSGFLRDERQHTIFTPNPEMLVAAHRNPSFQKVLNTGSLNICDGRGVQLFGKLKHRLSGVDFMQDLCRLAAEQGYSVYFLGAEEGIAKKTAAVLSKRFPNLTIAGWNQGPVFSNLQSLVSSETKQLDSIAIQDIIASKADLLFVAFGHQKQEMWINKHLSELPSVKIAMGVGGSFDFISGKSKRAPKALRNNGMEWLWRLVREPWRFKRIATALFVFPFYILKSKL